MSSVGSTWMPGLFSGLCAARGDGVWGVRGRCRRNLQWHPHVVPESSGILDAAGKTRAETGGVASGRSLFRRWRGLWGVLPHGYAGVPAERVAE